MTQKFFTIIVVKNYINRYTKLRGGIKMSKYSYSKISDMFIAMSNETQSLITNLKLQKLMYYAQAWHLAITGNRLFDETFEAWVHGPVLTKLYNDYKVFRWNPIQRDDLAEGSYENIREEIQDGNVLEILDDVIEEYFGLSGYELERLTHLEDPWLYARNGIPNDEPSNAEIKDDWMIEYYKKFLKQ